MALSVAELKAIASLDSKPFKAGMGRVTSSAKTGSQQLGATMGAGLKKMAGMIGAAFAVRAVVRFGQEQMKAADRTMDLVNALGLTAEQFQALEQSAEQFGGTTENVQKAMMQLRRVQGDVIGGNQEYAESFRVLGISQKDLENSTLPQLLERVATGYKAAGGSATAYNAASELMGRGGKELTGVLMDVADNGLQGIIDKGLKAGTVLSNEVTAQLAAANNELERTTRQLKNMATVWLAKAITGFRTLIATVKNWRSGMDWADAKSKAKADIAITPPKTPGGAPPPPTTTMKPSPKPTEIAVAAPEAADRLAKIGGIIGGQADMNRGLRERQLKEAERQTKIQERIDRNTAATASSTSEMAGD